MAPTCYVYPADTLILPCSLATPRRPARQTRTAAADLLLFLLELKPGRHFVGDAGLPPLHRLLSDLLDRLYGLYPVLSDHHFSHQARLASVEAQPELPLV